MSDAAAEPAKPDEPAMIEVWRPGGRSEQQRPPRHRRPQHRPQQQAVAAAPAEGAPAEAVAAAGDAQQRPRQDTGDRQGRRDRQDRPQKVERQGQRQERQDRQGRPDRGPRGDRPRRGRDDGPGRGEREQYYAKPHGADRRDKEPDPNSPFAKLAALKQQLEQNKDR